MSVSYEVKREIITQPIKSACCRRSFLLGTIFAKGILEGREVFLAFEKEEFADLISKLISEFYSKTAKKYRSASGGRKLFLSFDSASASKYILHLSSLQKDFNFSDVISSKCSSCIGAFLRGIFLSAGRLSDPTKQFSLEFTLGERADIFARILSELGMNPRISHRQSGDIVYFHTNSEIEDFFAHAGINHVIFDVIEAKINSLARRETQRFMNCVTHNYNRMVDVSDRQIAIIKRLDELDLLSSLPDELEITARMRMEFSDLPLSALAAKMTPAISKSGLSHRLKRIEEHAERLLKMDK